MVLDDAKGIDMKDVNIVSAKEMPVILLNNTTGVTTENLVMPVTGEKGIQKTNYK